MNSEDLNPVDHIMEVAGYKGNELFQTHEVVALMQKAFDKGWDQTGVENTLTHQQFTRLHNINRDAHVTHFLKEVMVNQCANEAIDAVINDQIGEDQ